MKWAAIAVLAVVPVSERVGCGVEHAPFDLVDKACPLGPKPFFYADPRCQAACERFGRSLSACGTDTDDGSVVLCLCSTDGKDWMPRIFLEPPGTTP